MDPVGFDLKIDLIPVQGDLIDIRITLRQDDELIRPDIAVDSQNIVKRYLDPGLLNGCSRESSSAV